MDGAAMTLPDISVAGARLPAAYESAKTALANCAQIDECQDWANKAEAMASYARQAEDDTLRKMADRIQGRAIRRCGELLQTYNSQGRRTDQLPEGSHNKSQREAAKAAGLSPHQEATAVRVANIPEDQFETAIESDDPPTVTKLAEQGKKTRPLVDLEGRDPDDFAASTSVQGDLRRLAEVAVSADADVVIRGAFPKEHQTMREHITAIRRWLDRLDAALEG